LMTLISTGEKSLALDLVGTRPAVRMEVGSRSGGRGEDGTSGTAGGGSFDRCEATPVGGEVAPRGKMEGAARGGR
jgi:hypothetical protein